MRTGGTDLGMARLGTSRHQINKVRVSLENLALGKQRTKHVPGRISRAQLPEWLQVCMNFDACDGTDEMLASELCWQIVCRDLQRRVLRVARRRAACSLCALGSAFGSFQSGCWMLDMGRAGRDMTGDPKPGGLD